MCVCPSVHHRQVVTGSGPPERGGATDVSTTGSGGEEGVCRRPRLFVPPPGAESEGLIERNGKERAGDFCSVH